MPPPPKMNDAQQDTNGNNYRVSISGNRNQLSGIELQHITAQCRAEFYYLCERVRQSRKWAQKKERSGQQSVNGVNHAMPATHTDKHALLVHRRFFEQFHFLLGIQNENRSTNCVVVAGSLLIFCWFNFVTYGWNVTLNFCLLHIKTSKVFLSWFLFCFSFHFRLFS